MTSPKADIRPGPVLPVSRCLCSIWHQLVCVLLAVPPQWPKYGRAGVRLENPVKISYLSAVQHGLFHRFRQIARTTMFMAISAFVLQGALISVSQAKAALGAMPEPSVTLSGSVHFHDQLAGHVHSHGGDHSEGHVHDGPDHDDDGGPNLTWSIFGTSIASPELAVLVNPFDLLGPVEVPAVRAIDGVRPDGLIRPPSTLSIA